MATDTTRQADADRELLELAAKAAGFQGVVTEYGAGYVEMGLTNHWKPDGSNIWAPLARDDDALRLAVKLGIQIWRDIGGTVSAIGPGIGFWDRPSEHLEPDPYAATRRALVRAAAEIGRNHHG